MAKNIYGLSLNDIIPSSIAGDPQIQAMIKALDPELSAVAGDIRQALIYSRLDELPENILNLLAWQWHVDFYEPTGLDVETKRNLVKSAIAVHRKKGTPWAVRRIMADLGFQAEYTEWWQFGGKPFVDRLKVWIGDSFDFSPASRDLITLAWNLTKAARTHLESLWAGVWFLDEFGEIRDSLGDTSNGGEWDMSFKIPCSFLDVYPWPGLRYGEFIYGGLLEYGDFDYGDGSKYGGGSKYVIAAPVFEPVRYGDFKYGDGAGYGDGATREGGVYPTRRYGEDEPDILSDLSGVLSALEDEHSIETRYGEARYGEFEYGSSAGVQDSGAEVVISKALVYGRFAYGDGVPRYGEAAYGAFSYGGSVRYGGEAWREAV